MPRALEKLQKSRNHNFSRHRRYRAPFPFALQSAYSQNPTLNVGDLSLLGCQRWIEVAAKCAILVPLCQHQ